MMALARQLRHALRVDIGRIGDNQVVAPVAERPKQIAPVKAYPVFKTVIGNVARGDFKGVL
jgi:hypothetical protein